MDITISFDRRSYKWCKQEHVNLVRLKTYEKQLNRQLESYKYVLLRDVFEVLGIPVTKESLTAGWVYDTMKTGFFEFKLHPKSNGVIEVILSDMEKDIRYAFPSENLFQGYILFLKVYAIIIFL